MTEINLNDVIKIVNVECTPPCYLGFNPNLDRLHVNITT